MSYGSYFDWIKDWYDNRHQVDSLVVLFEDMKDDLAGGVAKIAQFIGLGDVVNANDGELLKKVVEKATFDEMKVRRSYHPIMSKMIRKGIVGDWKNHFDEQESKSIEKMWTDTFKGTELENIWQRWWN